MFQVKDLSKGEIKYVTRSKATVIDTRDPLQRGRIRVDHPGLGQTVWIDYINEASRFDPPKIGDVVYLECDAGFHTHPIAHGRAIKGPDNNADIPSVFKRDVPTNRGMYTPGGHLIEMDDGIAPLTQDPQDTNFTTENRGIRVTSKAQNKIHIIEDVDNGNTYILIEDAGGNLIKLDYKDNRLTINAIGTTKFDTAEDREDTVGGNMTEDVTGDRNESVGGNLQIDVTGNVTVNAGGNALVDAGGTATVKSGGAATVDAGGPITLKSANNTVAPGGVVTDNTINNDPITGIPLTGVGGTDAN